MRKLLSTVLGDKDNSRIAGNILAAFIIKGGAMVLSLFTMPAYMRYFDDSAVLGVWFTMLSLVNWIFMFDLGLGNGLRNKLAAAIATGEREKAQGYISSAYCMISLLAAAAALVFLFVSPNIDWNAVFNIGRYVIPGQVLRRSVNIIMLGIVVQFVLKLIGSIFYALQKPAWINLLGLLSNTFIFIYVLLAPDRGMEENLLSLSLVHILATNVPLLLATLAVFMTVLQDCRPRLRAYSPAMAREVLGIGLVLFWLQLVWLVVSSTHAFLISHFISPEAVVEYQIYYKIYNTIASVFALTLMPIWSAVTKAQAEKRYVWIQRLSRLLLLFALACFVLELCMLPFLQWIVDFWLRENAITISVQYALIMTAYSSIFVLHNVNTSIGNGMSLFKVQNIWMGVAALLMVPLSYAFCRLTGSWIGVIIGCCLSVLPYVIIQPIWFDRYMRDLIRTSGVKRVHADQETA